MYKQGTVLSSLKRNINHPLFVMVYDETMQTKDIFKAIVLWDHTLTWEYSAGDVRNNWKKGEWEISTYQKIAEYSKYGKRG